MNHPLAIAFNDADLAWHEALVAKFGNDAGDARFDGRGMGSPGSALRTVYEARMSAFRKWEAEK